MPALSDNAVGSPKKIICPLVDPKSILDIPSHQIIGRCFAVAAVQGALFRPILSTAIPPSTTKTTKQITFLIQSIHLLHLSTIISATPCPSLCSKSQSWGRTSVASSLLLCPSPNLPTLSVPGEIQRCASEDIVHPASFTPRKTRGHRSGAYSEGAVENFRAAICPWYCGQRHALLDRARGIRSEAEASTIGCHILQVIWCDASMTELVHHGIGTLKVSFSQ
jgi:hypothetical protein